MTQQNKITLSTIGKMHGISTNDLKKIIASKECNIIIIEKEDYMIEKIHETNAIELTKSGVKKIAAIINRMQSQEQKPNNYENKQLICNLLLPSLKETREYQDLIELNYEKINENTETVTAIFDNNSKIKINVSLDSGSAMIRDILKRLQ